MAKETATLTFELEDEFSAKMQEITGKLEDFKRRLEEASRKGTEGFAEIGRQVKGVGEQAHGAIQHFSQIKSVSVEVTRALTGLSGASARSGWPCARHSKSLRTRSPASPCCPPVPRRIDGYSELAGG